VTRRTRGDSDAEDLLQSAYLRLERYRADHDVSNPAAFLVHAAHNIGIDSHRHRQLWDACALSDVPELADDTPLQDEVMAARARLARVREGLAKLPPRTREIFLMHRVQGAKYREIAERIGISQSAVEKHIAKAALFLTEWTQGW
jgi:RNA polymerase sigma-70 factor (ECF subfamily)